MKQIFPMLLLCATFFLASCGEEDDSLVAVTGVTLNKPELMLEVGETYKLEATVAPLDAENKAVTWNSSDKTVAVVSDAGLVETLKVGETTITATTADGGKTDACHVRVGLTVAINNGQDAMVAKRHNQLILPFRLSSAVPGGVTLTFAKVADGPAQENVHFKFVEGAKSITLAEGVLDGEILLEILEGEASDGCIYFDIAPESVKSNGANIYTKTTGGCVYIVPRMTASASSEAFPSGNEGGADFLIDGNMDTYWHSRWSSPAAELPHWVQVDMGDIFYVNAVEMWRRPGTNNDIKTCILQLGADGTAWTDIETYSFSEAADKYRIHAFEVPQKARYVRFHISESNRPPHAGMTEIRIEKTLIPKQERLRAGY